MTRHRLIVLLAAAALFPAGTSAGGREWEEDYTRGGPAGPSGGYDVSVDLNAPGAVGFESFHAPLAPYGDWIVVGGYGNAWRPRVAVGWKPYYYGRWEWTHEGWLWVSDEPWGWAVYHYGRWAHDPYHGWIWVPGYQWAPAWVSWRVSGDVVGWAPLAPGVSVYVSTYPFVDFWWTFVPTVRFVAVPVYTVAFAPAHTRRWYRATAPAPARPVPRPAPGRPAPAPAHAPAWGGPPPRMIAERTGRPVAPVRVVPAPAPGARGRAGEVLVFRPDAARPAPPARAVGPGPGQPRGEARGWAPAPGARGAAPAPAPRGRQEAQAAPVAPGRGAAAPAPSPGRGEVRGRADRGEVAPPPAQPTAPRQEAAPPPARGAGGRAAPPPARGGQTEEGGVRGGRGR
jgi:hypothetical protein